MAALAVLVLHRLARAGDRRSIVAFGSALAFPVAVRLFLNHHLWGTWLTSPHARVGEWPGLLALFRTSANRLAGMLVDQEYGILLYAPVFVLAAVGLVHLFRTRRPLAWQISSVTAAYVLSLALPITNVHGWTGGWSPAARFLVPVVPLIALAIPAGVRVVPRVVVVAILTLHIAHAVCLCHHCTITRSVSRGATREKWSITSVVSFRKSAPVVPCAQTIRPRSIPWLFVFSRIEVKSRATVTSFVLRFRSSHQSMSRCRCA